MARLGFTIYLTEHVLPSLERLNDFTLQALSKDTLWFVERTLRYLILPETLETIEYGALISFYGKSKARFFIPSSNPEASSLADHFENGDCLNERDHIMCVWCLMHFYGLNRTKDGLDFVCDAKQDVKSKPKKCYWTDIPTVPAEVEELGISYTYPSESVSSISTKCPIDDKDKTSATTPDVKTRSQTSTKSVTVSSDPNAELGMNSSNNNKYAVNDKDLAKPLKLLNHSTGFVNFVFYDFGSAVHSRVPIVVILLNFSFLFMKTK